MFLSFVSFLDGFLTYTCIFELQGPEVWTMTWSSGFCLFLHPFCEPDLQAFRIPTKLLKLFLAGHWIEQDSSKSKFIIASEFKGTREIINNSILLWWLWGQSCYLIGPCRRDATQTSAPSCSPPSSSLGKFSPSLVFGKKCLCFLISSHNLVSALG